MPAVLAVKEGLNLPRYPSVPGRLRAKKKEIVRMTPAAARRRPDEGATAAAGGQREHGRGDRPGRGGSAGRRRAAHPARGARPMILALVEHADGRPERLSLEALSLAGRLGRRVGRARSRGPARARERRDAAGAARRTRCRRRPCRRGRAPRGVRAGGLGGVDRPARGGHAPRSIVLAAGSDRGNEVMAHLAARTDLPLAANCHGCRARANRSGSPASAGPGASSRMRSSTPRPSS